MAAICHRLALCCQRGGLHRFTWPAVPAILSGYVTGGFERMTNLCERTGGWLTGAGRMRPFAGPTRHAAGGFLSLVLSMANPARYGRCASWRYLASVGLLFGALLQRPGQVATATTPVTPG